MFDNTKSTSPKAFSTNLEAVSEGLYALAVALEGQISAVLDVVASVEELQHQTIEQSD